MARQYVITEEEMNSLIDQLKLKAMQDSGHFRGDDPDKPPNLHDVHRAFHYVVVRWAQAVGFSGGRF